MPNKNTDSLFQLIKSLSKGEKRNFKLYVARNSGSENLKIVQLFDAMDKMNDYDEQLLLHKNKDLKKQQLSNSKAYLFRQIMVSLRLIKNNNSSRDITLHVHLDFARILYSKGLYIQSLKLLDKLKETARNNNQLILQLKANFFEKQIESLHITRSMDDRAEQLSKESNRLSHHLQVVTKLSNLALELYSWYIKHGHVKDDKEVHALKLFFDTNLPDYDINELSFYEKLYLYQAYCWYGFIMHDLLSYYRYTQKWVVLFEDHPVMKMVETSQYIRGMHNLLSANFNLSNYYTFNEYLQKFEDFAHSETGNLNNNAQIQTFIYLHIAKLNKHFLEGSFEEGLLLVPYIEEKLEEYALQLDRHRVLIFYYKIACLYFGNGNYGTSIKYLNNIINLKADLRADLQCYARLLHLIAHFELGNYEILEHLIKSVYRFMGNMQNLTSVEEEIFRFIRKSFSLSKTKIIPAFKTLKERLEKLQGNPMQTRSFMYLDIISWLESKIDGKSMQEIRKEKYEKKKKHSAE